MYSLSNSSLQDISVKCVALFMSKQACLSEAIADEAKNLELNPDQIKRVIETTNTLAYLRQLKDAEDRTFEFPVATYTDVMGRMVVPTEKRANEVDSDNSTSGAQTAIGDEQEVTIRKYNLDAQEKRAMLYKESRICRDVLVKMAEEKPMLTENLLRKGNAFGKEALALEKLAEVVTEEDFPALLRLCGIEKTASDITSEVFTDSELVEASQLYSLYKEAKALIKEEEELTELVKRASEILFNKNSLDELRKEAGVASWLGGKIGSGLATVVSSPVKAIAKGLKGGYLPEASKGFTEVAKHKGYKSTDEAVKAFDRLKSTKGHEAALKEFGGNKPAYLAHRLGVGGIAGKAMLLGAGESVEHKNNVWDTLNQQS